MNRSANKHLMTVVVVVIIQAASLEEQRASVMTDYVLKVLT